MSVFHQLSRHPDTALARVDPFAGESVLLRRIDPRRPDGRYSPPRVAIFWVLLWAPTLVFAWQQPEHGFARLGTGHLGDKGLFSDVDVIGMWIVWACYLTVLVVGRRLLGSLLIALEQNDLIARKDDERWTPRPRHALLRFLLALTRLDGWRSVGWVAGLMLLNLAFNATSAVAEPTINWRADHATPGTLFYIFSNAREQPNLAGLWHLVVASGMGGYLILLISRLYVVFACLSADIGEDPTLRIIPTHPDGTGGLLAIGQASLTMSAAVFVSGLGLTVTAIQANLTSTAVNGLYIGMCVGYLVIGPLLFFLPQAPLRRSMLTARRTYLDRLERAFQRLDAQHDAELDAGAVTSRTLADKQNTALMIERAEAMTVWPFDRRTFRRFFAILVAPALPALSPILRDYPIKEFLAALLGLQ